MSLAEAKHRSISRLVLKALQDASISDAEFASIMSEVEQYYDLKAKFRQNNSLNAVEKVDDAALREEIKKKLSVKIRLSAYNRKELRIEFDKRPNGFSLFICRHTF